MAETRDRENREVKMFPGATPAFVNGRYECSSSVHFMRPPDIHEVKLIIVFVVRLPTPEALSSFLFLCSPGLKRVFNAILADEL